MTSNARPGQSTTSLGIVRCGGQWRQVIFLHESASRLAMTHAGVTVLARTLSEAGVRYIVVGGLAVNVHGYARFTRDIDVVISLDHANVLAAFAALATAGWRPLVPVTAEQMADSATRERLVQEKGMAVLSFWSDAHRDTPVDVFVHEPFDFEVEYARALRRDLPGVGGVPFVSLQALIAMKRAVGRPQDLADVAELELLKGAANG
jgi:hypothetical protein